MPVRNESAYIRRSLQSVLTQDYDQQRLEILVVDGMSSDGTAEVVSQLASVHPNLRLLTNEDLIVPPGLNKALREAKGEIIIRVDGHCEITPDYVKRCVEHLIEDNVDAVGGPIETIGETESAKMIALAMSSPFGVGGSSFRTLKDKALLVDTVAFPAYLRAAIERTGFFDEELVRNQDDEYNFRLRKLGGRILLSPDIRSRYYSRSSLRSLWRQYFQYGYWKVRVMQKHWRQMRLYHFAPVTFVSLLMLTLILSPFFEFARLLFAFMAFSYLIVNIVASARTWTEGSWRQVPLLSIAFAILHFSYGLGFLWGLVRFWNRWSTSSKSQVCGPLSDLTLHG